MHRKSGPLIALKRRDASAVIGPANGRNAASAGKCVAFHGGGREALLELHVESSYLEVGHPYLIR